MATKPTGSNFAWARDTNFTHGAFPGDATKVVTTAQQKAEGFLPGEQPPTENLSYFLNLVDQLAQYTLDGAFTGGMSVVGGFTADTIHATGLAHFDAGIEGAGATPVEAPLGIEAKVIYFTDIQTFTIPHYDATDPVGVHFNVYTSHWRLADDASPIVYGLQLPVGSRLRSYQIALHKDTNASSHITALVHRVHEDGTIETVTGTDSDNNDNGPLETLITANFDIEIEDQWTYSVWLVPDSGAHTNPDQARHALIGWTFPKP